MSDYGHGEHHDFERYLNVDVSIFLQMSSASKSDASHVRSCIRGWKAGGFIMLDMPTPWAAASLVKRGAATTVRFISNGVVCGFTSYVLDFERSSTHPHLMVAWPKAIEVMHVRQDERLDVTVPCRVHSERGRPVEGRITDLSAGGCRLISEHDFALNEQLSFSFALPDGGRVDNLAVTVRNRNIDDVNRSSYGCQFVSREAEGAQEVAFFVHTTLERMRGRTSKGPRVLIGSKNEPLFQQVGANLQSEGYEVLWAATAVDSVFRLRLTQVDAVLISSELPGISGANLCHMLKATPGFERLPLLLCSNDAKGEAESTLPYAVFAPSAEAADVCSLVLRHINTSKAVVASV